jgi:diadenosine tetraphosphatase ApaH/serine/threonine PP2A family protein phosphatase
VLRALRESGAASIWCLGDLVGYGADPSYCLATCTARSERCLAGNHDLGASGRIPVDDFSALARAALRWTRGELGAAGRARLDRLEPSALDGDVELFHASPRDPVWEYVVTVDQARAALEDRRVALTLIGHTHLPGAWCLTADGAMRAVRVQGEGTLQLGEGRWLVNPGSVGQPRDGDPRAAWALYDADVGTIRFRRTPYDVAAAQGAILAAGLPEMLAVRLSEGW